MWNCHLLTASNSTIVRHHRCNSHKNFVAFSHDRWRKRLPLMAINEIKKNLTNIFIYFFDSALLLLCCVYGQPSNISQAERQRWDEMWTNGWCLAVIDLQLCRRFYVFTTKQWVPKIDEKGTQNNCAEQFSAFLAYFIPHLFFFLFLVSCCLTQIVFSLSLLPKLLFVLSPFPSNKVIKVRLSLFRFFC